MVCLSVHVCVGTERKYSAPTHHTTEHVPEKKFKSEALLSTLTSDASKENTPGTTRSPGHPQPCVCVCVLTSVCVFCRLPYQQHALVHQQRVQCELLSASGLLQPERSACGARGRSRGHHHGCSSGCPGHSTGQNTDTPRPGSSLPLYPVSTLSNSLTVLCKLAAWFWSGPDEGGPQDLQSESQLRGHQEQRLPAGPRVRSVPGQHRVLLLCSGLHPHPDPRPQHRLGLQGAQVQVRQTTHT